MEAIKNSKVIVILLILYTAIAILVVTLDKTQRKKDSSKSNSSEQSDVSLEKQAYIDDVSDLYFMLTNYLDNNDVHDNVCIPLSNISTTNPEGSAYVNADRTSIRMWYSDGTYVINNMEMVGNTLTASDLETEFNTPYYNSCGLNE